MSKEEERMQTNLEMVGDLMRALNIDEITVTYSGAGDSGGIEDVYCTNTNLDLDKIKAQIHTKSGLKTDSLCTIAADLAWDAIDQAGYMGFENDNGGGGTFTIYSNNTSILEHYYNEDVTPSKEMEYKLDENDEVAQKLVAVTEKILARNNTKIRRNTTLDLEFINNCCGSNDFLLQWSDPHINEQEEKELVSIITNRYFDMIRNLEFEPESINVSIKPGENVLYIMATGLSEYKETKMEPVKFGKPFEIESLRIETKPNKIKP